MSHRARGERAGCGPRCTVRGLDAPGRPSRGVVTCDSPDRPHVRWGSVRVVTTGWRRVVTTRLAQRCWGRARQKLQQRLLGRRRYGLARSAAAVQALVAEA
jgi:hypothetical protein